MQRMPVIRRRQRDGVDLLVVQQAAKIGFCLRPVAGYFFKFFNGVRKQPLIDVADFGDFDIGYFIQVDQMAAAAIDRTTAADADDGDANEIGRASGRERV
mgnify:CR=1 FL=1